MERPGTASGMSRAHDQARDGGVPVRKLNRRTAARCAFLILASVLVHPVRLSIDQAAAARAPCPEIPDSPCSSSTAPARRRSPCRTTRAFETGRTEWRRGERSRPPAESRDSSSLRVALSCDRTTSPACNRHSRHRRTDAQCHVGPAPTAGVLARNSGHGSVPEPATNRSSPNVSLSKKMPRVRFSDRYRSRSSDQAR